jgi:hypothetical protein
MVSGMSQKPGTARALAAAQAVADAHSVACDDAVLMAGSSNVLVHLKPAPIVARVMTSTAVLHDDVELWLAREVAVGAFLAEWGLGVPPSGALACRPYQHEGFWMTFWEFVEHDASPVLPGAHELGASLRGLHDALARFPGELGQLSEIRDWLDGLLVKLRPSPTLSLSERDLLRSRLHEMTPTVFESSLPVQAIHGDASIRNLLRTGDRLIWNDLEDACVGPVHWDVAGLISDARGYGASESFVTDFLHAYDRVELDELDDFVAAHDLYSTVWRAFATQRRAADGEAA